MTETSTGPAGKSRMVRENPLQPGEPFRGASPTQPKSAAPQKVHNPKRSTVIPDWVTAGKPFKGGPRLMLWHIYVTLKMYKVPWIPQPRPCGMYLVRCPEKIRSIRSIRKSTMAIVTVLTTKGGATKTTVSTWLAAVLMYINKLTVLVFDIDTGGGKVTRRYGLDSKLTLESRETIKRIATENWRPTYQDLVPVLEADEDTGVMVFHCAATKEQTEVGEVVTALPVIKSTGHTLVVDAGPGFEKIITEGAVKASSVACVVGRHHSKEELDDVTETLNHEAYGLRENAQKVLVVISGVRWWSFNTRTQYAYADKFGVDAEQVVLMPYVRHLFKVQRVSISKLTPKALYAQVVLAERVTMVAMRHNLAENGSKAHISAITEGKEQHEA